MTDFRYRLQVTLAMTSGVAADSATNVWHLASLSACTSANWTAIVAAFKTFYSGSSFGWSHQMASTGHSFRLYDYADPKPRPPRFSDTTLTLTPSVDAAPQEVAICLSGKATPIAGIEPRKMRGRVYLGPWSLGTVNTPMISSSLCGQITTAGKTLVDALNVISPNNFVLGVTNSDGTDFYGYSSLFVDNAWDIQRRRGPKANFRSTVTVP